MRPPGCAVLAAAVRADIPISGRLGPAPARAGRLRDLRERHERDPQAGRRPLPVRPARVHARRARGLAHQPHEADLQVSTPRAGLPVCGCWDYDAYLDEDEEPCFWVAPDVCSGSAPCAMRVRSSQRRLTGPGKIGAGSRRQSMLATPEARGRGLRHPLGAVIRAPGPGQGHNIRDTKASVPEHPLLRSSPSIGRG